MYKTNTMADIKNNIARVVKVNEINILIGFIIVSVAENKEI